MEILCINLKYHLLSSTTTDQSHLFLFQIIYFFVSLTRFSSFAFKVLQPAEFE